MGNSQTTDIQYAVLVPNKKAATSTAPGEGDIRRNPKAKDSFLKTSEKHPCTTLYEAFQLAVRTNPSGRFVGTRIADPSDPTGKTLGGYRWKTYAEAEEITKNISSAFAHLDLCPANPSAPVTQGKLGLFSTNREEWVLLETAANRLGLVTVPLYDTLGPQAVEDIVQLCEIHTVCCSAEKFNALFDTKKHCPTLKSIIMYETPTEEQTKKCKDAGVTLYGFEQLQAIGKSNAKPDTPPKAEDVATFCFTSGTTGKSKGAMLTHGNIIADVAGVVISGIEIEPRDVHVSYLPLAHMFERCVVVAIIMAGASMGFFQGNPTKLLDDIAVLKPTIFPSVPRLFSKIHDKIKDTIEKTGGISKALFDRAFASKEANMPYGEFSHMLWDRLVFSKIRQRLGGRVRYIVTGSAPISADTMNFLRICFCATVFEGYGQTECAAAGCLTHPLEYTVGHVGGPLACNEIKLVDVAEMNYTDDDKDENGVPTPRGEVCFRGTNVFKGYYKMDDLTKEAIDKDGWLHSGDIGMWLPNNALKIIDRKKNIFKLSQGEYVAAEKIENVYKTPLVAQSFVYGDSLKHYLVGIIVPEKADLEAWARTNNIAFETYEQLCANPEAKKFVMADLTKSAKDKKLRSFECVKTIYLEANLFSVENDLLTPTFKLKRPQAKKKYEDVINKLYAEPIAERPE